MVIPSAFSLCDALQGLRSWSSAVGFVARFIAEDLTGTVKAPILLRITKAGVVMGCFDLQFKEIRIALDSPELMVSTLAHELTHALEFMAWRQWANESHRYDAEISHYNHRLAEGRAEGVAVAVSHFVAGVDPYTNSETGIQVCQVHLNATMWLYKERADMLRGLVRQLSGLPR